MASKKKPADEPAQDAQESDVPRENSADGAELAPEANPDEPFAFRVVSPGPPAKEPEA